jgi:hypothetical protein
MDNKVIGSVFKTASGKWRRFDIFSCGSYGVTCPGLFTTNGSARAMSEWLAAMLADARFVVNDIPDYTVQVFVKERRCQTYEEIFLNVMAAHTESVL